MPPTDHEPSLLTEEEAERLSAVMQGLASPVRLRILSALRLTPSTVTELCTTLEVNQTTMSNHLRLLRNLGLVTGRRHGRNISYELFDEHVAAVFDEAVVHLGHLNRQH